MDEIFLLSYLRGECNDEEAGRVEAWCKEAPGEPESSGNSYTILFFVGDRVAMMNAVDTEASLDKFKSAVREKERRSNGRICQSVGDVIVLWLLLSLPDLFLQAGLLGGWYLINFRTMRVLTVAGQRAQTVLPGWQ